MHSSERQESLIRACIAAQRGRKVAFCTATEIGKEIAKKEVGRLMNGAWPIGLKIIGPEEGKAKKPRIGQ